MEQRLVVTRTGTPQQALIADALVLRSVPPQTRSGSVAIREPSVFAAPRQTDAPPVFVEQIAIDYRADCDPPLAPDDAEWANALLQKAGLRSLP